MSRPTPPPPKDKPLPVPPRGHARHQEALVDEAVAETMVASDPISPYDRKTAEPEQPRAEGKAKDPADRERADRAPDAKQEDNPSSWQDWPRGDPRKPGR